MTPHAISPTMNGLTEDTAPYDIRHHSMANGIHKPARSDTVASSPSLQKVAEDELHDLICVGFGPAALAIAIAIHDALENPGKGEALQGLHGRPPKVAFLERQSGFAWHSGMLLEGAKMQISFIKDMATLRNPRSPFTFINYLHSKDRLVQFTNLNTFTPHRVEFEDYLRWCASSFSEVVSYSQEVLQVDAEKVTGSEAINCFTVRSRDINTNRETVRRARHVVVAMGGTPEIPQPFPHDNGQITSRRIVHSSSYARCIHDILDKPESQYRVAIVGSGQSAAEIFENLHSRYPNSRTHLVIRGSALRPSDDSPFVNEIFNPERIATFFDEPADVRSQINTTNRNTNYGVVRLDLLERIYETLYHQRLHHASEEDWAHRILTNRTILNVDASASDKITLDIYGNACNAAPSPKRERFEYDLVVLATGYRHNGHEEVLAPLRNASGKGAEDWTVEKNYRLSVSGLNVSEHAGIWLQGCNEKTHGLADTLLSGLAVRGGEIVDSIFGSDEPSPK